MNILNWFGLVSGAIGIAAFVWAWILNSQQRKINKHILREKEDAFAKQKQALVRAEGYKCAESKWKVRIWNDGAAPARNIRLESSDVENDQGMRLITSRGILPFPLLNQGEEFEINALLASGYNPVNRITLIWDDDSGERRTREQILTF